MRLPESLLAYIDSQAKQRGMKRSQIVADVLENMRSREVDDLAAEGYRFYSNESLNFAAVTTEVVAEARNVAGDPTAIG